MSITQLTLDKVLTINQKKYFEHYSRLMLKAITRVLDGYSELHHIVPVCLGGLDILENKVRLTPEEHFVAHQLLIKIFPSESKLVWAAKMMTIGASTNKRGNKLYGWLRRKFAEKMSLERKKNPVKWTLEMRLAMSLKKKGIKGVKHTDATKKILSEKAKQRGGPSPEAAKKIAEKNRGRKHSLETRQKMSLAHDHLPRFISQETRKIIGQKMSMLKRPPEFGAKVSAALKGKPKPIVTCPYCKRSGGKPSMMRFHFDNCKKIEQ